MMKTTRCKYYVYGTTLVVVLVIVVVIVLFIVIVVVVVIAIVIVVTCACFPSGLKLWSVGPSFVMNFGQNDNIRYECIIYHIKYIYIHVNIIFFICVYLSIIYIYIV